MTQLDAERLLTHVGPAEIPQEGDRGPIRLPGRRSLRVSIIERCNLQCGHCHNEGHEPPWMGEVGNPQPTILEVDDLLRAAVPYSPTSVKFTGGEPGLYRHIEELLTRVEHWRKNCPTAVNWGISTNGIPFLKPEPYRWIADSALDSISVGLDSIEEGELSKPSSRIGMGGSTILRDFVDRLHRDCPEKRVKINVVFTGNRDRVLRIVRATQERGIDVSVIELNRVMQSRPNVRAEFLRLLSDIAQEFKLDPRPYLELNEIYLYPQNGAPSIRFYQDHCADMDCGHCRALHLRVGYTERGWAAFPCFLQSQAHGIPLVIDNRVAPARFEDAIRLNGRGPEWDTNTPYSGSAGPLVRL
jgi:molybdenum cofactor biosynthesis enzyme MoaA